MANARAAATDVTRTVDRRTRPEPFGAPHVYLLVVIDGDNPAAIHRIVRPDTIVGRGEEAHFSIDDEQVSKAHCRIRVDGPVCTIFDLGSRNGTILNGRRLAPDTGQRLRHLDEIEIGSYRVLVLAGRFRQARKNAAA
jgi:pSer/pThr/pTyr-binding forkhead associated (FHA) protein